ncbi:MAG: flagellar assembly peptidoglycan hydrolase FlgJ [Rhizobacter sp.]|nr:flagellar assembly peptidoglycan hydrolase FlgJ [Rhizobacter sp.]
MFRPDTPAFEGMGRSNRPFEPAQVIAPSSVPSAARSGSSATFSGAFASMQDEIKEFIQTGSPSGAPVLSPEGRMQLARIYGGAAPAADAALPAGSAAPVNGVQPGPQLDFLSSIAPWAREAGAQLGVSGDIIAAHAALESGWGQKPLRQADGSNSNNLFGIKATGSWQGDSTDSATTEFESGVAVKKTERFRSYPDPASSFRDFAQMLRENPRYREALNSGGDAKAYAEGLARGGYATDPNYADKLARVAAQVSARGKTTP